MDPWVERFDVANHEAGHAVAAFLLGLPIQSVDIDRPDAGVRGRIGLRHEEIPAPPEGTVDPLGWINLAIFRRTRDLAIVLRMGALVASEDWTSHGPSSDREKVQELRPGDWSWDTWELLVAGWAEELLRDRGFRPAFGALTRELLERRVLSGSEAEAVIRKALHVTESTASYLGGRTRGEQLVQASQV